MTHFSLTVLRNSTIGLVAQMAIKVLSFAFSVLIVRRLGAEQYGQYAAVLAVGGLLIFLADRGLSPYTVRAVARLRDQAGGRQQIEELFGNLLRLRVLLAFITGLLIIASAWLTKRPPEMIAAIALGALGLLFYSSQGSAEAILYGFERLDVTAGARVAHQLTFVVLGAIALVLGIGYYGLVGANLVGILVLTFICWQGTRRLGVRPGQVRRQLWPGLIRSGIPFGIIGFTLGLSYRFDTVLLNIFQGDIQTGYYNAAYSLVFATIVLSNVVNTALYPSLTRQAASNADRLPMIYARTLRYLLIVSLPIAVGGYLLAHQIIPFLFESDYAPAIPGLRMLIWVVPLMFLSEFLGYAILVDGREGNIVRAVLVSTSLNVLANLLLVPRWGYMAAAAMTVFTEFVLVAQYLYVSRQWIAKANWKFILVRPLIAVGVMAAVILALHELPLLVKIATGAAVYAGMLIALRVLGHGELNLLRSIRSHRPAAGASESWIQTT